MIPYDDLEEGVKIFLIIFSIIIENSK